MLFELTIGTTYVDISDTTAFSRHFYANSNDQKLDRFKTNLST